MAVFTEKTQHKLEILPPFNIIQCRTENIVEKDGEPVGSTFFREVFVPGSDISSACEDVKKIANLLWTDEIIANYRAVNA